MKGRATRSGLLFGASSVTGYAIFREADTPLQALCSPHHRSPALRHFTALSLESTRAIRRYLDSRPSPDWIIYAHAVCDVPACRDKPRWARQVNVDNLSRVLDALPPARRFVYISSDHVFPGNGDYDENVPPEPRSVYGETRVAAEALVLRRPGSLVIRCGLPIGRSADGRTGHRDWLLYRTARGLPVTIIRDEVRSVYPATEVAQRILAFTTSNVTGVRHLASAEPLSRPELAGRLLRRHGRPPLYTVCSRADLPAPHPGRLVLLTRYRDALATPLAGIDAGPL